MEQVLQIFAGVLVAVILAVTLQNHSRELTMLLGLLTCCVVLIGAVSYLRPMLDLLRTLRQSALLDSDIYGIMIKAVGIGLISELISLICADCGQSAMARGVQILAGTVILWLSLPLMNRLLTLIQDIAGGIG